MMITLALFSFPGIHLCPACQRCTELPANYYPRYINELTCDNSQSGSANQTSCYLTSFLPIGNCEQVTMVFDVLVHQPGNYEITFQNSTHTVYTAVYVETPYEVRTCCECMVYSKLKSSLVVLYLLIFLILYLLVLICHICFSECFYLIYLYCHHF